METHFLLILLKTGTQVHILDCKLRRCFCSKKLWPTHWMTECKGCVAKKIILDGNVVVSYTDWEYISHIVYRLDICRCASPQHRRQLGKYFAVTLNISSFSFSWSLYFVFWHHIVGKTFPQKFLFRMIMHWCIVDAVTNVELAHHANSKTLVFRVVAIASKATITAWGFTMILNIQGIDHSQYRWVGGWEC